MRVDRLVDSLAGGVVLVFGSVPPAGRDLDLLARPPEESAIARGLAARGFTRAGRSFVAFRDCSADVVELVATADWGLPAPELRALFEDARPLDGAAHLVRPAPHHALLIEARKAAWSGLADKSRRRVERLLREEPGALGRARAAAPAWGAEAALEALAEALRSGGGIPPARRARALESLLRARGERPARACLEALRAVARRPRRGLLVTLSGLDGAGKSSQAEALREALDRLGYDAVVQWTSLSQHPPLLHALTDAARWVLRRRGGDVAGGQASEDPGKALRERSAALTFGWSTLVALTNAVEQSRGTRGSLWRGRVVICDRYTLDSKVHLRYAYGDRRAFALQTLLIRLLSPRPDRAYLLDVSPETATRRKQDYPLEQNARRAALYREEQAALGVRRVDGERPREEVCAEIAADVWALLERRRTH